MRLSRLGRLSVAAAAVAVAALATAPRVRGDLDRIAADGVTEHGGSPEYARMLPRTGADGILDASLLPPVADWASQPISNLYYAAGNAPTQGNGSPQHPFNTLTHALSHMAPDSALLLAPATYSGTLSLPAGRTVALVGFGPGAYVSGLSVSAAGSSPATRLALVGVSVGTLSLSGGTVDVRLSRSTVARLEGTASAATVTRTDMGSLVGVSTLTHVDVYAGYDTAPRARVLTTQSAATQLALSGGRAVVSDGGATNTVAYLSDVVGATNGTYLAMQDLRAADAALSGRMDAEESARLAGDAANSNRLEAARAALAAQMSDMGTTWTSRLMALVSDMTAVQGDFQDLNTQTTNDIRALQQSLSALQTAYQAADTALSTGLTALQATVNDLSNNLTAVVDAEAAQIADARIEAKRASIVSNAVSEASSRINVETTRLRSMIVTNNAAMAVRMSSAEGRLSAAVGRINGLIYALGGASNFTNNYHITLPAPISP